MALSIGIVGLPNVGKSTTFNALIKEQNAQVANYPFCTIEPNKAIVPVPDPRVERLAELIEVDRAIHATIQFVDVAGLEADSGDCDLGVVLSVGYGSCGLLDTELRVEDMHAGVRP